MPDGTLPPGGGACEEPRPGENAPAPHRPKPGDEDPRRPARRAGVGQQRPRDLGVARGRAAGIRGHVDPDPVEGLIGGQVTVSISFDNAGTEPGFGPYLDLRLACRRCGRRRRHHVRRRPPTSGQPVSFDGHRLPRRRRDRHPSAHRPAGRLPRRGAARRPAGAVRQLRPRPAAGTHRGHVRRLAQRGHRRAARLHGHPGVHVRRLADRDAPWKGRRRRGPTAGPVARSRSGTAVPRTRPPPGRTSPAPIDSWPTWPPGRPVRRDGHRPVASEPGVRRGHVGDAGVGGRDHRNRRRACRRRRPTTSCRCRSRRSPARTRAEDVVVELHGCSCPDVDADGAPVIDPATGVHRSRCATTGPRPARSSRSTPATGRPVHDRSRDDVTVDDHVLTARSLAVQKTADPLSPSGSPEPGGQVEYRCACRCRTSSRRPGGDRRRARRRARDRSGQRDLHGQRARRGDDRQLHGRRRPADRREPAHLRRRHDRARLRPVRRAAAPRRGRAPDGRLDGGRIGGTFGPTTVVEITFTADVLDSYRCPRAAIPPSTPATRSPTTSRLAATCSTRPPGRPPADTYRRLGRRPRRRGTDRHQGRVRPQRRAARPRADRIPASLRATRSPSGSGSRWARPTWSSLAFTDFLPLPVIAVAATRPMSTPCAASPRRARVPRTGRHVPRQSPRAPGARPSPPNAANNSVTGDYGTFANPDNPATLIELLFTVADPGPAVPRRAAAGQPAPVAVPTTARRQARTATAVVQFTVNAPR